MSTSKKTRRTVSARSATPKTPSNTAIASSAKAILARATTLLAAGEPLTTRERKEVLVRSIQTTPGMVTAAAAAYTEQPTLLGGDLDASAALDAQDFVTQMTPVATELRTLTSALEDRISEHKASSAEFTQTVYDRLKGLQSMPKGTLVASRLAQIAKLRPKRKKKATAASATPDAEATPATPTEVAEPPATTAATPATTEKP